MLKLTAGKHSAELHAKLAALDCCVLIRFDPIHRNSRVMQVDLVKSCMRTIFNIPENRDFMWSGYPSEPILAEAVARILNHSTSSFMYSAPEILESALNTGLLARGERGELVARTLFTVAHDIAILASYPDVPPGPRFHRPLKFVTLLEHLLAPDIWTVVRNAQAFHAYSGGLTLENAFHNAWVNFSHFVQLGDHASFTLHCASELLKRGVAIQTFDNQYNMDGGLPLFFSDPDKNVIIQQATSMAQYQVKNAASPIAVHPDPTLVGLSKKNLPIISIIMQFGVEMKDGEQVIVTTTPKNTNTPAGNTRAAVQSRPTNLQHPADISQRHYIITLYGCTSKTYCCIPNNLMSYSHILRAPKPFADFPRADSSDNASSLNALKPMIYDKGGICMPWS